MVNVALPTAAEVAQTRQSCYPTPFNLSDETDGETETAP
jgi:hypothetical protein